MGILRAHAGTIGCIGLICVSINFFHLHRALRDNIRVQFPGEMIHQMNITLVRLMSSGAALHGLV